MKYQDEVKAYEGQKHLLDECYNDGAMWRACISPSALTGEYVECIIYLDEDTYTQDDLIPDYYKWVYDTYIEVESSLKPLIASHLMSIAEIKGAEIPFDSSSDIDTVLSHFPLSIIYIKELDLSEESENGHVELHYSVAGDFYSLTISVRPAKVLGYIAD